MRLCAVSDLHITDDVQDFLFTEAKERVFGRLVAELEATDATLVMTGDVFDFTAMHPPRQGLGDFFLEAVGTLHRPVTLDATLRDWDQQLAAIKERYPTLFKALAGLARRSRLKIIMGNHDCSLRLAPCVAAFGRALEVPLGKDVLAPSLKIDKRLLMLHGHQFDAANRTETSCLNPGAIMTSALYHGVLPALQVLGVAKEVCDAVPAVRPEEAVVTGLERYLGEARARRLVLAFARLLARNDYFRGLNSPLGWLLQRDGRGLGALTRFLVTPDLVKRALPDDRKLKLTARRGARGVGAKLVVMGHTHELDLNPNYVNLGTWIDHVTGLDPDDLAESDKTLPILLWDDGEAVVRDIRDLETVGSLPRCAQLWRNEPR